MALGTWILVTERHRKQGPYLSLVTVFHKTLLVLTTIYCGGRSFGQQPYWSYGIGGSGDDRVNACVRGEGGAMYFCGSFSGVMHWPGGMAVSNGVTDVFLMCVDTSGQVQWVSTGGGPGPDMALALTTDGNGGVVVTGQFSGTGSFPPAMLISNGPSQDMFMIRYDALSGALDWARAAGSTAHADMGTAVAADASGNIFVAGRFTHTAQFGSFSITSTFDPLLGAPGPDVFLAKYNSAGAVQWVRGGQARYADQALGLAADDMGDAYLTGQFSDTITFDAQHPNLLNNAAFLVKFNASGSEQWFHKIGGGSSVLTGELRFVGGSLYLSGEQTGNNLYFAGMNVPIASPYSASAFVLEISPGGAILGQRTIGSDHDVQCGGLDVHADALVLGGTFACQFTEPADVYNGDGLFLATGPSNGWMARLDLPDLDLAYMQQIGCRDGIDVQAVAIDEGGKMYAVGNFGGLLILPAIQDQFYMEPGQYMIAADPTPGPPEGGCQDTTYYDYYGLTSQGVSDGFICRGFAPQRALYDFFDRSLSDDCVTRPRLEGCVSLAVDPPLCSDTVSACAQAVVMAALPLAYAGPGTPVTAPLVDFLWSNGSVQQYTQYTTSGWIWVNVSSQAGCYQFTDSAYVQILQPPDPPGITDSQGINVADTLPDDLMACIPEVITLTAELLNGNEFFWVDPGGNQLYDTTISCTITGNYTLIVQNEAGCDRQTSLHVSVVPTAPLDTAWVNMWMQFSLDSLGLDSLEVCPNSTITASVHMEVFVDSAMLTSNGAYQLIDSVSSNTSGFLGSSSVNIADVPVVIAIPATGPGWMVVSYSLRVQNGPCGLDWFSFLLVDSVYIDTLAGITGAVDIYGPIRLCDGDTVMLTALANGPGTIVWSGPGIVGAPVGEEIQLSQEGYYYVAYTPLDTGVCTTPAGDVHLIQLIPPPLITMYPADGLICPNDTVWIASSAEGSYQWYGPGGPLPFTSDSIPVQEAGIYFAVVTSPEGCERATNLVLVDLYGTPYISIFPQPELCAGGSVEIVVQPQQNATIVWDPPLSGTGATQTVTMPGTYSCQVTVCGITSQAQVTVLESTVDVAIADTGPFDICPGDSVQLSATPGLVGYIWWPGGLSGQTITVNSSGAYEVVGLNEFGCADTAGTAVVNVLQFTEPIGTQTMATCEGDLTVVQANGSGTIIWYGDEALTELLGSGTSLLVGPLNSTDTVFAVQVENGCTSPAVPAVITMIPGPGMPLIDGDTVYCAGEALQLIATVLSADSSYWSTPTGLVIGNEVVSDPAVGGIYVYVAYLNGCDALAELTVLVVDPGSGSLPGTITLCEGGSVTLDAGEGSNFAWNTGSNSAQITVLDGGIYVVEVIDQYGCVHVDSTMVVVDPCELDVPNVLSPNGDGQNEMFLIRGPGGAVVTLIIFNRWGQRVANLSGSVVSWDGRNALTGSSVPDGVYFYEVTTLLPDGMPYAKAGYIHVMR